MKKKRRTIELAPQTAEMFARCVAVLKPPPELTLSQWADTYRMLSAENSATPGRWHTDNAPYQREIMDAIGDQHVRKVVVMSAAQIGKTAMLMNMLGYYMHYYPAPVLVMQPPLEMGQTFSKDFLAPMIRDTPVLRVLVDTKSRYSGNTILKKNFPGGHVTIIGANSPASLASRPIKVLLCDEATSALDPKTTRQILELIRDINRQLGITVVVITHQMSVVEEICDSVAILDGGVVMEEGSVQEIFANPKTAAAKRLVAPNGGSAARDLSSFAPDDHVVRVTFNGSSTAKPLVASLAAEKGILVSVLSADTRDLSGQCYGSMLLKLPADVEQAKQAAAYMRSQPGVTVEEVTGE